MPLDGKEVPANTVCDCSWGTEKRGDCIWMVDEAFLRVLGGARSIGGVWFLGDRCDWSRMTEGRCVSMLQEGGPHWERTGERDGARSQRAVLCPRLNFILKAVRSHEGF